MEVWPRREAVLECRRTSTAGCGQASSRSQILIQVIPLMLYAHQGFHGPHGCRWGARCHQPCCCFRVCTLLKRRQPKTTRDKLRFDSHAVRLLVCSTLEEQWPRARSRDTSRRFVCLWDSERTTGKPGSMRFLSWDPGKWWDGVLSWGRGGLAGGDPRSWMG